MSTIGRAYLEGDTWLALCRMHIPLPGKGFEGQRNDLVGELGYVKEKGVGVRPETGETWIQTVKGLLDYTKKFVFIFLGMKAPMEAYNVAKWYG